LCDARREAREDPRPRRLVEEDHGLLGAVAEDDGTCKYSCVLYKADDCAEELADADKTKAMEKEIKDITEPIGVCKEKAASECAAGVVTPYTYAEAECADAGTKGTANTPALKCEADATSGAFIKCVAEEAEAGAAAMAVSVAAAALSIAASVW